MTEAASSRSRDDKRRWSDVPSLRRRNRGCYGYELSPAVACMVDQLNLADLAWETSGDPGRADVEAVHAGLDGFNRAAVDLAAVRPLGCFARLPSGRCVAGAIARTWGGCCEITQLWVGETHRARGVGSRLVRLVEDEARARGCSLVYLDTFSFQAPGFYGRLGYDVAWAVKGFPGGITRFFLRKRLG